jgi:polyphosphate kinase
VSRAEIQPETEETLDLSPRYLNRELSRLDFMERVLALAEDQSQPLLERVKFLAIFTHHLDEFFQIRVAGLKEQAAAELAAVRRTVWGRRARAIARGRDLTAEERDHAHPRGKLGTAGIRIVGWEELKPAHREEMRDVFESRSSLSAARGRPAHPFQYISDLSLNLAVIARGHSPANRASRGSRSHRSSRAS